MQVPETLIGSAIAIALLPTLSEQIARGEREAFLATVNRALRSILALTIPVAVLMMVGLKPVVQTLLGFNDSGTEMVMWAMRAYLLGLAGHALLEIGARSFYAQQNAIIPLFAAALNAFAYILFAVPLTRWLGLSGIAIANSLAFTGEALLLLYLLNRRFPGILQIQNTLMRVLVGTALGGIVVFILLQLPFISLFILSLGAMALGAMVVLPLILPEMRILVRL
jgi:putative peptidoglycan lipid II flippase